MIQSVTSLLRNENLTDRGQTNGKSHKGVRGHSALLGYVAAAG